MRVLFFICLDFQLLMSDFASLLLANGFLPTRGSLMLDFVSVAMLGVTAVLSFSIFQVRSGNRDLHRFIQITTMVVLTLALIAFEIDVRFFTDWREIAKPSPYYESGWVHVSLWIHLAFAIPTPIVWVVVIWMALTRFRGGYEAADFNRFHRISGRIAASMMFMTACTGWMFYYLAFVAS